MEAYFGNAFIFSAVIFVLSFVSIGVFWFLEKIRSGNARR